MCSAASFSPGLYISIDLKGLQAKLKLGLGVQPGNFLSNLVLLVSLRACVPSVISFGMLNLFLCLFPSSVPSSSVFSFQEGRSPCVSTAHKLSAGRSLGLSIVLPDHEELYLGPEHSPPSGFVCLLQLIRIVNLPLKSNSV